MFKKSRKGVTLIELIIVIAIIGIIGSIPYSMYMVGQKSHAATSREFDIQSNIRLASQKLTNTIRKSSATFLYSDQLDESIYGSHYISAFKDNNAFGNAGTVVLDSAFLNGKLFLKRAVERFAGWSFLVLNDDKTELREFKWTITGEDFRDGYYTMTRIIQEQNNPKIIYDIVYEKKNNFFEDAVLEFSIVGGIEGSGSKSIKISSEVDALNSLQVIDKGKNVGEISTAIFFRSDDRPVPNENEAVVAMVLDRSGSMGNNMDKGTPTTSKPSRISILKTQANDMIDKFANAGLGKTNINVFSFATSSNSNVYNEFLDVTNETNRNTLKGRINALSANGGTNVGDGMRRAYYRILAYNSNDENKNKNKYMIILMDGVPTYASVHSKKGYYSTTTNHGTGSTIYTDEYGRQLKYSSTSSWPTNYTYQTLDSSALYVLDDGDINESGAGDNYANKGGLYGSGSDDGVSGNNRKWGKEYINQISSIFYNIKNSSGRSNLKVFLIGFSAIDSEVEELGNIQALIESNGIPTKRWVAKNGGDLNNVFNEIRNIIMEETWHIDGPDWSIPAEGGD